MNLGITGSLEGKAGSRAVQRGGVGSSRRCRRRTEFEGDEVARKAAAAPGKSVGRRAVKPASSAGTPESAEVLTHVYVHYFPEEGGSVFFSISTKKRRKHRQGRRVGLGERQGGTVGTGAVG